MGTMDMFPGKVISQFRDMLGSTDLSTFEFFLVVVIVQCTFSQTSHIELFQGGYQSLRSG